MPVATPPSKPHSLIRFLQRPGSLILVGANLVPIIGVIFWGWDAFVLLILYWLETAVIAFWTVVRVAASSPEELAGIQFGDQRAISSLGMAAFFSLHAGLFMAVHFLFLWTLFSDDWSTRIHRPRSFIEQLVIDTGLWVPLLILFIARGALILFDKLRPRLLRWLRIVPRNEPPAAPGGDASLIFGLYLRIFVMQFTIIIGAWFALLFGSSGALVILIAVKTAIDLGFQWAAGRVDVTMRKAAAEAAREGSSAI